METTMVRQRFECGSCGARLTGPPDRPVPPCPKCAADALVAGELFERPATASAPTTPQVARAKRNLPWRMITVCAVGVLVTTSLLGSLGSTVAAKEKVER